LFAKWRDRRGYRFQINTFRDSLSNIREGRKVVHETEQNLVFNFIHSLSLLDVVGMVSVMWWKSMLSFQDLTLRDSQRDV
jgi:hypothetical protein